MDNSPNRKGIFPGFGGPVNPLPGWRQTPAARGSILSAGERERGMQLRELVELYRKKAGQAGQAGQAEGPVALKDFGLPKAELEKELSAYDEDYQISRFLQFSRSSDVTAEDVYNINGVACTHLKILPGIDVLL
jgi:hypothetical protein